MRVSAFTPTYADLLRPETVTAVNTQSYRGDWGYEIGEHNPYPPGDLHNVLAQYERARGIFLGSGWEALWLVEHDNVPPATALTALVETMAEHGAGVVYAPYLLRHGTRTISAWRYEGERGLGMPLMHYPEELAECRRAGVERVSGVGFGCTLLRRDVVERIPFRAGESGHPAPDVPFAEDCLRAGIVQMCRFDTPVLHLEGDEILDPYEDLGTALVRVMALQSVNVFVAGRVRAFEAGQEYDVPADETHDLIRCGYAEPVELSVAPPEPQHPEKRRVRKSD